MILQAEIPRAEPRKSEAGFTLLEMLVVLTILGAASALVLARGPARSPTLDARAAAGELVRALRVARGEAIVTGRRTEFVLDLSRRRYRTSIGGEGTLSPALDMSMTSALGEGMGTSTGGIGFYPDGSASGGRIVLAAGAARAVVEVNWLTGRVSVGDGR